MQTRLSRYGEASTKASPVSRMMAEFARGFRDGVDINLGVGYVNEATIPIDYLQEAMNAVAGDPARYRQAFNYGSPAGSANLVDSLRRFLSVEDKRLVIPACGATSILDALTDVMQPGIVVTSDPSYYIYTEVLERKGFEVLAVPEDTEGIDLELLEHKLAALGDEASHIEFLYVVTVNNPSCTMLSNRRRRALLDVVARLSRQQNRRIPVFYDLAYELLLHNPAAERFVSVLPDDELGIAYEIGTLSKVLAPALRIGYLLGPDGPLMNAMVQKTADTGFSAPLFVQEMASYVLDHHVQDQLRRVNAGYGEKAVAVRQALDECLGPHIEEIRGGSAGFYYYLTLQDIETHPESVFFAELTGRFPLPRVIYIPGSYCVHPRGDLAERGLRQLRISYAFEEVSQIVRAIGMMREAAGSMTRPHMSVTAQE